jgi:tripeptidyl-peptidase-1
VPVYQANKLLGASYQHYRHTETNDIILRTMSYALPEGLQDLVQTVTPTTYFHSPRTPRELSRLHPRVAEAVDAPRGGVTARQNDNNGNVTPLYLRQLYNSVNYVPNATEMNVVGIAGYLGMYPRKDDIDPFMEKYRPDAVGKRFDVVQINGGGYSTGDPSLEGDVNMEYSLAMTYPIDHVFYSTGGEPPFIPDTSTPTQGNEPYLDFLTYILEGPNIPQTITSGYADDEKTVPMDYAITVCYLFAQVAARGTSVVVDSGYYGVGRGNCDANDGSGKVRNL